MYIYMYLRGRGPDNAVFSQSVLGDSNGQVGKGSHAPETLTCEHGTLTLCCLREDTCVDLWKKGYMNHSRAMPQDTV